MITLIQDADALYNLFIMKYGEGALEYCKMNIFIGIFYYLKLLNLFILSLIHEVYVPYFIGMTSRYVCGSRDSEIKLRFNETDVIGRNIISKIILWKLSTLYIHWMIRSTTGPKHVVWVDLFQICLFWVTKTFWSLCGGNLQHSWKVMVMSFSTSFNRDAC